MDPFTIAALGGLGLQAIGGIAAGVQAKEASDYNAQLLMQRAAISRQVSESQRKRMVDQFRQITASQRAAYGKSGAAITSGTPLTVMTDQAGKMQLDILEQQRNAAIEEMRLKSEANAQKYAGKQSQMASLLGTAGTLLGGAYQFKG